MLKILQWNPRSINSNKGSFEYFLHYRGIKIALINNTQLKPNQPFNICLYFNT